MTNTSKTVTGVFTVEVHPPLNEWVINKTTYRLPADAQLIADTFKWKLHFGGVVYHPAKPASK